MSNELAQMILAVVSQIPKGKVASYGQIAKLAGLPKHARLVGRVLGQIEDRTAIPWHRVINSQGKMSTTQLTEHGDHLQQILLLSEGVVVISGRVNLKQFAWLPLILFIYAQNLVKIIRDPNRMKILKITF